MLGLLDNILNNILNNILLDLASLLLLAILGNLYAWPSQPILFSVVSNLSGYQMDYAKFKDF